MHRQWKKDPFLTVKDDVYTSGLCYGLAARMKRLMVANYTSFKKAFLRVVEYNPVVSILLATAQEEKHKVYLVGGFLRDVFLGRGGRDLDFVSPTAADLANSVALGTELRAIPIDRKFGTIRFIRRSMATTKENSCQVDLSPLKDTSIEGDLQQRDFTINAFAVDISVFLRDETVKLVDPLGGLLDLQRGLLRCCSRHSLSDDPLRILRAYRLVSSYGLTLEDNTKKKIFESRSGLNKVAVERIRDELVQILSAENSVSILAMLDEDNVLPIILPECMPTRHSEHNQFNDQHVWQHTLAALKALEFFLSRPKKLLDIYADQPLALLSQRLAGERTREIALKFALLLHAMGKPSSGIVDKHADMHFDNQQVTGARLAASLCRRLRFSNSEIDYISRLVRLHRRPAYLFHRKKSSRKGLMRFFGLGPEVFWPLLLLFAANYSAKQGLEDSLVPLNQRLRNWLDFYTEHLKPREKEPCLVDGHDLMARFELPAGPTIGRLLRVLAELQWEGKITTRQEALNRAAEFLKQWRVKTAGDNRSIRKFEN
jgi:tRNA nucleotidyltransferase/poly(A) polymerase